MLGLFAWLFFLVKFSWFIDLMRNYNFRRPMLVSDKKGASLISMLSAREIPQWLVINKTKWIAGDTFAANVLKEKLKANFYGLKAVFINFKKYKENWRNFVVKKELRILNTLLYFEKTSLKKCNFSL